MFGPRSFGWRAVFFALAELAHTAGYETVVAKARFGGGTIAA
jgi:hypothetical protein